MNQLRVIRPIKPQNYLAPQDYKNNIMPHQNKMGNMVTMVTTTNQPKRMKKKKKLGHTLSHSYQKSLFTESLISYATTKIVLMIEVSHNATVRVES